VGRNEGRRNSFEVYLNGEFLLWSKLECGRFPADSFLDKVAAVLNGDENVDGVRALTEEEKAKHEDMFKAQKEGGCIIA